MLYAIARLGDDADGYSLMRFDPEGECHIEWWCGDDHGWVSPQSSYWVFAGETCWNVVYPDHAAALRAFKAVVGKPFTAKGGRL